MDDGSRVALSVLAESDREDFLEAMIRSTDFHDPWITPPRTRAEFDELLRRNDGDEFVALVIRLREDGRLAGVFQISQILRAVANAHGERSAGSGVAAISLTNA
jgi:ribosomal-protein-alanine N-acetyltransferase